VKNSRTNGRARTTKDLDSYPLENETMADNRVLNEILELSRQTGLSLLDATKQVTGIVPFSDAWARVVDLIVQDVLRFKNGE